MASFQYKARDASGNAVTGQLEAGSQAAAADMLKQRRYIPLSIEAIVVAEKTARFELWQAKVSLTELIIFSRQMYSLMKAGIPIIRSIKSLAESTGSPRLRQVMTDLASELENGRSLSVAMASHPKVFSRLIISLVHVGENTGRLDDAFLQLTFYFEQELETRKQIKQATRYPIFVLFALVVAMVC